MMVRRSILLAIACCLAVVSAGASVALRADAPLREGQSVAAVRDRADVATIAPRATIRSPSVDVPRAPIPGIIVSTVALVALAIAGLVASDLFASTRVFRRGVLSSRSPPLVHA
jgi:hypothetical protein